MSEIKKPSTTLSLTSKEREAVVLELGPDGGGAVIVHDLIDSGYLQKIHDEETDNPDDEIISERAHLHGLARAAEFLVRFDLSRDFAPLRKWWADDLTYHQYIANQAGSELHRDDAKHWGVIAIAALSGEAEFHFRNSADIIETHRIEQGDVVFVRGAHLYEPFPSVDNRVEHRIGKVSASGLTTYAMRANKQ